MVEEPHATYWFEEGQKQFVVSKIKPGLAPQHYPTQDTHTPKNEADYISGYNLARKGWENGEGFGMMQGYADEFEAQQKADAEKKKKADEDEFEAQQKADAEKKKKSVGPSFPLIANQRNECTCGTCLRNYRNSVIRDLVRPHRDWRRSYRRW